MENNDIELDKAEELLYLISELKNTLHYIEELHLIVDRESRKVELSAKFQL